MDKLEESLPDLMPEALAVVPAPQPDETLISWVARTGPIYRMSPTAFIRKVREHLSAGLVSAVPAIRSEGRMLDPLRYEACLSSASSLTEKLARFMNQDVALVAGQCLHRHVPAHCREWMRPDFAHNQYCDACLREMVDQVGFIYERIEWRFSLSTWCIRHGTGLKSDHRFIERCGTVDWQGKGNWLEKDVSRVLGAQPPDEEQSKPLPLNAQTSAQGIRRYAFLQRILESPSLNPPDVTDPEEATRYEALLSDLVTFCWVAADGTVRPTGHNLFGLSRPQLRAMWTLYKKPERVLHGPLSPLLTASFFDAGPAFRELIDRVLARQSDRWMALHQLVDYAIDWPVPWRHTLLEVVRLYHQRRLASVGRNPLRPLLTPFDKRSSGRAQGPEKPKRTANPLATQNMNVLFGLRQLEEYTVDWPPGWREAMIAVTRAYHRKRLESGKQSGLLRTTLARPIDDGNDSSPGRARRPATRGKRGRSRRK